MDQYLLSNHVFVCVSGDHAILLDLRHDKYMAIPPAHARTLATLVRGWPFPIDRGAMDDSDGGVVAAPVAQLMLQKELLTMDPACGKEAMPIAMEAPSAALLEDSAVSATDVQLRHIADFVSAALTATIALRFLPIEKVIRRVRRRKLRRRSAVRDVDIEAACRLVGIFYRLRPFLFTSRDECLFDSLALVEFLARYRLYPTWVFGVQSAPFVAHCWVQDDGRVFNDTVDHVRNYTPIMAV